MAKNIFDGPDTGSTAKRVSLWATRQANDVKIAKLVTANVAQNDEIYALAA